MARVIAALALPVVLAAAADSSRAAESSLSQIRDTLRNLRRSIEDEGHDAESFYELRQKWCDDTLHKFDEDTEASRTSLVHLGADLKEHEAAVEEAEGTAQQIRADIALVQHTLNQTEATFKVVPNGPQDTVKDTHRLLTMLVQNKKQTLTSLQGELQVVLPTLAQLQARLAETQRRYVDRNESATVQMSFAEIVRSGCSESAAREDAKATARISESSSIEAALQALDQLSPARAPRQQSAPADSELALAPLEVVPSEVSFVQTSQDVTSEDDLMSIFAGPARQPEAPAAAPAASSLIQEHDVPVVPKAPTGSQIQQLLSQLNGKQVGDKEQSEWCSQEKAQNQLVLRLAKASVSEIDAEINSHVNAEAQIAEELQGIAASVSAIQTAAKDNWDSSTKESQHIAGSAKDQALATKILTQAVTILGELERDGKIQSRNEKGFQTLVASLSTGKAAFEQQTSALKGMLEQIALNAKSAETASSESLKSLDHEQANLELIRDSHVSLRENSVENKRVYETQASEASEYSQTLSDECDPRINVLQNDERNAQIHALQDAQKVLEGRELPKDGSYQALRGNKPQKSEQSMSPMERAAAEMGVEVDGN